MKKFFLKIINSEETARRRWFWVFSAAGTALVILLWLPYMDYSISSKTAASKNKENNFWEVMSTGSSVIAKKIEGRLSAAVFPIFSSRRVTIKNLNEEFEPRFAEPIPPANLP